MADDGKAIKQLYDESIEEVQRVLFSLDATDAERKVARQSLRKLTALLLAQTIKTVEGRTALLNGLIDELGKVIEKIKVKPPLQNVLDRLNGAVAKAKKLLDQQGKTNA
ncbi:MAG: hypothetical protein ACFCUQ_17110 [Kiloniellales bacterium]